MSRLVEQIAELTTFRDRDLLDFSLATALRDLLCPLAIAIYRPVGEPGGQHWLTRARIGEGTGEVMADSLWSELEALPALHAWPHHAQCLQGSHIVPLAGTPAATLFPLAADGAAVGVLEVHTRSPLAAAQQQLVCSILRIYRNFQGLLDYSERDTLTGLLNRKTFDDVFMRTALATLEAPAQPEVPDPRRAPPSNAAWLGLIDVDHFKRVNDGHGHLIGDEVLLLLSRLMRGTFRYHDQLFRFGGEEFVVLMRCGSAAHARVAVERLRAAVERHAFPRVGRITVSIGMAQVRAGDTPAACFERADRAIYHAKHNGRNRVCEHGELVERGLLSDASRAGDVEIF